MRDSKRPKVVKPLWPASNCWAEVHLSPHVRPAVYTQCARRPRKGKLTCSMHADREKAAQRLKATTEETDSEREHHDEGGDHG